MTRKEFITAVGLGALSACSGLAARGESVPKDASDEALWDVVRSEYPVTRNLAYFNTGGLGPAPTPVMDAFSRAVALHQGQCDTGHDVFEEARATTAAYFGVAPQELCFTRNTTEGNNIVVGGLDLVAGDEVILDSHAHPGGSFPWYNQLRQRGVVVKLFDPSPESPEENVRRIQALITSKTKAIQVSHVTAPTGILMPVSDISALARGHGLWFHVDGAQSAGMVAFNVKALGCDSFATSGHKWLGAPHETGLLIVRNESIERLKPIEVGAYSGNLPFLPGNLTYSPGALRFEYGTRSAAAVTAVAAAIEWHKRLGVQTVQSRGIYLADRLREGLRKDPDITVLSPEHPALRTSILTLKSKRVPYDHLFGLLLSKHKIRARPVSEQGLDALRFSLHIFNSTAECDQIVAAVRDIHRNA